MRLKLITSRMVAGALMLAGVAGCGSQDGSTHGPAFKAANRVTTVGATHNITSTVPRSSTSSASTSSSSTTASSTTGTGTGTSTSGTGTSTSAAGAPTSGKTLTFGFKDDQGWTYNVSVPLPQSASLSMGSDISSSPPGQAELTLTMAGGNGLNHNVDFPDTNPGRPGGPNLVIDPVTLDFVLPAGSDVEQLENRFNDGERGDDLGPCALGLFDDSWSPSQSSNQIECNPASGSGESGQSASQRAVDHLASYASKAQLVYVYGEIEATNAYDTGTCNIAVYPSGRVYVDPNFDHVNCGRITSGPTVTSG